MKIFNMPYVTLLCFLAAAHILHVDAMRDEREIFGHAKMHAWNRLKDPSLKVEYHNGKDEHGQTLQTVKLKNPNPPIEVEARILHKRRFHAARRAVEGAIMRKLSFREQMKEAWSASYDVLSEPSQQRVIRRLEAHFEKTGRRLAHFVGRDRQNYDEMMNQAISSATDRRGLRDSSTHYLRYGISRDLLHGSKSAFVQDVVNKFKKPKNGRNLNGFGESEALSQPPLCEAHKRDGREWMANELCLNKVWRQGENREGYDLSNRNLCDECSQPGQLCHEQASCQDFLLKCQSMTEADKQQAAAEYERVKAESPDLHKDLSPELQVHPCLNGFCPALRNEIARNSKCGEAVYQYCCNPLMQDCPLTKKTSCTVTGCSEVLNDEWRDLHWLIEEAMAAEGVSVIRIFSA